MIFFKQLTFFVVLLQNITKHVLSENATKLNSTDAFEAKDADIRPSNRILIVDNSAKNYGQQLTSQKLATNTYTTSLSSSGAASSSGGYMTGGVVLQPQLQGVLQSQPGCGSGSGQNVLTTGEQASNLQKKSTVESAQSFNGGTSINSLTSNKNQWQLDQNGVRVGPLVVGQAGGQSSMLHGSSSQYSTNNLNDITGTIITGNKQGVSTVYDGVSNIQQENILHPENTIYKVALIASGDGIYANELTGQQAQNLNVMVSKESNSPNIVAVPVTRPQLGQVQGYRPNMQYYLSQIEANSIQNPSTVFRVPSFIENIEPNQININLSEEQLNSYRQYLIQTGLIKLKPYQLIFSDQFRPKLSTLQWMVVPLEYNTNTNWEYCKQRCGNIFARNTLYSTIVENASKLPLKLLVPVLKVRSGLKKTVTGAQTIAGGVSDISDGVYRMLKDSPSHVGGLLEKPDDSKKQD